MRTLGVWLTSFVSLSALAAPLQAPDFTLTTRTGQSGSTLWIATPPAGHHFNVQAPTAIVGPGLDSAVKPSHAIEAEVRYELKQPTTGSYAVSLYLCDDAKTFCEKHVVNASWDLASASLKQVAGGVGAQPHAAIHAGKSGPIAGGAREEHGFLVNMPDEALKIAREKRMPLMIDFFGIWCPPCNELDEDVFSKPEFQKSSDKFVKLKLDADADVSWALKSKYKVGGYPTIVFASPEGEEISRVAGFRKLSVLTRLMSTAWELREKPLSQALEKAKDGDRAALDRLGLAHLDRDEFVEAARDLDKTTQFREQLYMAQIGQLDAALKGKESTKELMQPMIKLLEASILSYPDSPEAVDRRSKLAGIYEELKDTDAQKSVLEGLTEAVPRIVKHPERLENHDVAPADLWSAAAEGYTKLHESAEAKKAWQKAIAEYRHHIKTGKERGYHLEMAYCLWQIDDFAAADKIYSDFEALYPTEFTFYFNHANMKMGEKKYGEVEALARKAEQYSYGDNRLRASHLLARAIQAQGRKAEALQVITGALKSTKLPDDKGIRTHRYVKKLQDLERELKA